MPIHGGVARLSCLEWRVTHQGSLTEWNVTHTSRNNCPSCCSQSLVQLLAETRGGSPSWESVTLTTYQTIVTAHLNMATKHPTLQQQLHATTCTTGCMHWMHCSSMLLQPNLLQRRPQCIFTLRDSDIDNVLGQEQLVCSLLPTPAARLCARQTPQTHTGHCRPRNTHKKQGIYVIPGLKHIKQTHTGHPRPNTQGIHVTPGLKTQNKCIQISAGLNTHKASTYWSLAAHKHITQRLLIVTRLTSNCNQRITTQRNSITQSIPLKLLNTPISWTQHYIPKFITNKQPLSNLKF